MMLITIIYLACAAFVLIHLAKAPHLDDEDLPDDPKADAVEPPSGDAGGVPLDKGRIGDRHKRIFRMAVPSHGLDPWDDRAAPA